MLNNNIVDNLSFNNIEASYSIEKQGNILPTMAGEELQIRANNKPLVVYFFAPWCQVCHLSIENLESFYLNNPHIDVIAVALDYENKAAVRDFMLSHQLTFPVALGNTQTKEYFKVSAYPSYYFVDADNNIKKRAVGYSSSIGLYFSQLFL